jgi:hypothetical protein
VPAVLGAAGWEPEFSPSDAALNQWKAALAPRKTLRVTAASFVYLAPVAVWAWLWPGRAPVALSIYMVLGFAAVMTLVINNYLVRRRAERRLAVEYKHWRLQIRTRSSG